MSKVRQGKKHLLGLKVWGGTQGDEPCIGFTLTFTRHDNGTIGVYCHVELFFLYTVGVEWNWY